MVVARPRIGIISTTGNDICSPSPLRLALLDKIGPILLLLASGPYNRNARSDPPCALAPAVLPTVRGRFRYSVFPRAELALEIQIGSRPLPILLPFHLSTLRHRQVSPPPPIPAAWRTNRCPHRERIHYQVSSVKSFPGRENAIRAWSARCSLFGVSESDILCKEFLTDRGGLVLAPRQRYVRPQQGASDDRAEVPGGACEQGIQCVQRNGR